MTEKKYLELRIRELLDNLSRSGQSYAYRNNQTNALEFYLNELRNYEIQKNC